MWLLWEGSGQRPGGQAVAGPLTVPAWAWSAPGHALPRRLLQEGLAASSRECGSQTALQRPAGPRPRLPWPAPACALVTQGHLGHVDARVSPSPPLSSSTRFLLFAFLTCSPNQKQNKILRPQTPTPGTPPETGSSGFLKPVPASLGTCCAPERECVELSPPTPGSLLQDPLRSVKCQSLLNYLRL